MGQALSWWRDSTHTAPQFQQNIFYDIALILLDSQGNFLVNSEKSHPSLPNPTPYSYEIFSDVPIIRSTYEVLINDDEVKKIVRQHIIDQFRFTEDVELNFFVYWNSPDWGCCNLFSRRYVIVTWNSNSRPEPEGYNWDLDVKLSPCTRNLLAFTRPIVGANRNSFLKNLLELLNHLPQTRCPEPSPESFKYNENDLSYSVGLGHFIIPFPSNTLAPFTKTNTLFLPEDQILIDPGVNEANKDLLISLMKQMMYSTPTILITHSHHDHIDSVGHILSEFKSCTIIAHSHTLLELKKKGIILENTETKSVCENGEIEQVTYNILAIPLPGHTSGHIGFAISSDNTIYVGDHVVGHGSTGLDFELGGDMLDYIKSTNKLIELGADSIIPSHGEPIFNPSSYLTNVIAHRAAREKSILDSWNAGLRNIEDITTCVYGSTRDPRVRIASEKNTKLYLRKLHQEGVIQLDQALIDIVSVTNECC